MKGGAVAVPVAVAVPTGGGFPGVTPAAFCFLVSSLPATMPAASAAGMATKGMRDCTLPGAVQTPMLVEIEKATPTAVIDQVAQPIGRRSSADEQAMALLFLGSPQSGYINGAALPVDGGFMATIALR